MALQDAGDIWDQPLAPYVRRPVQPAVVMVGEDGLARICWPAAPAAGEVAPEPARPAEPAEPAEPGAPGVQWPSSLPPLPGPGELAGMSEPVRLLVQAVAVLADVVPTELPGPQALAETAVLLAVQEQLRVVLLGRLGDVDVRGLAALADASTTTAWVRRQRTSIDAKDVTLARRLGRTG